jgi:two-component system response regulator CpxR
MKTKSILIIDDDITMTHLLTMLLELEGFTAASINPATDEIFQRIVDEDPDCILMDVYLKSANGIEIAKALRKASNFHPRIILTSGMDLKKECMEAGADDFLMKPYMPEDLLKTLKG